MSSSPEPSPQSPPAAVLIGTAETLSILVDQLALLPGSPAPAAFISVDGKRGDDAGTLGDLPRAKAETNARVAIVSLPGAMHEEARRVREAVHAAGLEFRFVPPLQELLETNARHAGPAIPAARHEIDVTDLIGRTPYGIDRRAVSGVLEGRRVLITGAGGSIGSEIARIAATFHPRQLVLMERSENALFEIDRQIARKFPDVERRALLHDITDAGATMRHAADLRPDVIFHAAAHKHVPLMEDHPAHALTNNLFGTKNVADAALAAGASRFVLISSDKAVNPTSVMGATKRLAEMYIQGLHRRGRASAGRTTSFSMVRFGNVLGSACSVLPIWSAQISEGGPVTVTDPRMTRYFMTIHEAAMLVIQSAAIPAADDAAVFVLDMGEPVKIMDLALRFIRAHGLVPRLVTENGALPFDREESGTPIDLAISGRRPGEKLHEELCYAAEQLLPTRFPGIHSWAGEMRGEFDLAEMIADLDEARTLTEKDAVVRAIRRHVPEMHPEIVADSGVTIESRPVPAASPLGRAA